MMKFLMFYILLMYMMYIYKKSKIIIHNMILMTMIFWFKNLNLNNMNMYLISMNLSIDTLSYTLIMLTMWIIPLSILSNFNFLKTKFNMLFLMPMLFLKLSMTLCFTSMNMFNFYFFFESSMIPIMLLILMWGIQIDRIQASMYMLFYTLFGSLPLLLMIMYLYNNYYSLMMNLIIIMPIYMNYNLIMYLFFIMAMLIKMPMYLLHLWLPKAHVESPISGSMILAGIMLKLGSYGLMRMLFLFKKMFSSYNLYFIIISIYGGLISCLICLNMNDMKIIVAYSSIVHMSTLMASMLTYNFWGYLGSLMMMIAHGLCSSSLFFLVNLNYERTNSRNFIMNKGMINFMPTISLWWFLMCSNNMSAPPSLNLISEIMIINSIMIFSNKLLPIMMMFIFFSSLYNILLFSLTQHGKNNFNNMNMNNMNIREYTILINHWLPLNITFLNLLLFN